MTADTSAPSGPLTRVLAACAYDWDMLLWQAHPDGGVVLWATAYPDDDRPLVRVPVGPQQADDVEAAARWARTHLTSLAHESVSALYCAGVGQAVTLSAAGDPRLDAARDALGALAPAAGHEPFTREGEDTFLVDLLRTMQHEDGEQPSPLLGYVGDGARLHVGVDVSDAFAWGSADAEDIDVDSLPALQAAAAEAAQALGAPPAPKHVAVLYAARRRQMRPQGALYHHLPAALWPLLDACGPQRNAGLGNPYEQPGTGNS